LLHLVGDLFELYFSNVHLLLEKGNFNMDCTTEYVLNFVPLLQLWNIMFILLF